ncbi:MAG TPA: hypothetical protein VL137_16280 [Polyangiaceae bacterium]|nr:hypothetical protein [Polyangiaceae bacterium]
MTSLSRGAGAQEVGPASPLSASPDPADDAGAAHSTLPVAPAVPENWSIHWQAPETCPSESAVHEEIQSLLAGSTRSNTPLSVTAVATETDHGFSIDLQFDGPRGSAHRAVQNASCVELARASALIVALAIDPGVQIDPNRKSALAEPPAAQEAPKPKPPPPLATTAAERPKPPAKKPMPARAQRRGPAITLAAGAQLLGGTLPSAAFGAQVDGALSVQHFRAALSFDGLPARNYDAALATTLRAQQFTFALRGGYEQALLPSLRVYGELGLRVGQLAAQAQNSNHPQTAHTLLLGPQVDAGVEFGQQLGLRVDLGAGAETQRPQFIVQNRGVIYQPRVLWEAATLGLFWRGP